MHTHFIIPPPQVLREMKGEHEIKEAEDKVEGARVLAVAAKAEREDWEGRQREALSEMRLDQLKVSNKSSPPPRLPLFLRMGHVLPYGIEINV